MNGTSFEIWSGEKLAAEIKALDILQRRLAEAVGVPEPSLTLWLQGKRRPKKEHARNVQRAVSTARQILANSGDIKPDFNDVRWLRKQIRKASNGRRKPIPQESGSPYLRTFCRHAHIAPEEFCDRAQLSWKVATADVVSLPAQRWIKCWTVAFARELNGKLFDEFAVAYPSRDAALESLTCASYARIVAEVGAPKIREYLYAMILTGELAGSPSDVEEN